MIHYNMRYRGPYEYEKFVLNIFQFANEVTDFITDAESIESYETLKSIQNEVNKLFIESTGPFGTSETIYKRFIMFKEAKDGNTTNEFRGSK